MKADLIPIQLSEENIFKVLLLLQNKYEELYGSSVYTKGEVPTEQIGQSIAEFIDLVMFTSTTTHKHYLLKRLVSLKSVEKVLDELSNYLPIEFDKNIDPETSKPKTFYIPRLLKVTMRSLTINNLSSDFIGIIDTMFEHLLYFIQYELTIQELIYRIEVGIQETLFHSHIVPVKSIMILSPYYLSQWGEESLPYPRGGKSTISQQPFRKPLGLLSI